MPKFISDEEMAQMEVKSQKSAKFISDEEMMKLEESSNPGMFDFTPEEKKAFADKAAAGTQIPFPFNIASPSGVNAVSPIVSGIGAVAKRIPGPVKEMAKDYAIGEALDRLSGSNTGVIGPGLAIVRRAMKIKNKLGK